MHAPQQPRQLTQFEQDELTRFGTSTTEVTEGIPSEVYSQLLLEAVYAADNLRGVVAATTVDLTATEGDTVSVPIMPSRTASSVSEGAAVSDSADDPTEATLTLSKFGTRNDPTNETFEDSIFRRQDFTANLMAALSDKVTEKLASVLFNASATKTATLGTAGNLDDLYERLVEVKQAMKGDDRNPTFVGLHPDITERFLKDERQGVVGQNIVVEGGEVQSVAGLRVIENSHFQTLTSASGRVLANVVDPSRAVAEAWGRQPDLTVDETTLAEQDKTRLIAFMRYENTIIENNAVGHVKNP